MVNSPVKVKFALFNRSSQDEIAGRDKSCLSYIRDHLSGKIGLVDVVMWKTTLLSLSYPDTSKV